MEIDECEKRSDKDQQINSTINEIDGNIIILDNQSRGNKPGSDRCDTPTEVPMIHISNVVSISDNSYKNLDKLPGESSYENGAPVVIDSDDEEIETNANIKTREPKVSKKFTNKNKGVEQCVGNFNKRKKGIKRKHDIITIDQTGEVDEKVSKTDNQDILKKMIKDAELLDGRLQNDQYKKTQDREIRVCSLLGDDEDIDNISFYSSLSDIACQLSRSQQRQLKLKIGILLADTEIEILQKKMPK